MKNPIIRFLLLSILLFTFAFPAFAWDDSGHKLVAYIAWQQMSPEAREKAVKILLNAPEDSQLNALYPTPPDEDFTTYPIGARSKAAKQRDYFMIVAYWADIIRNRKYEKRSKYHHGTWHYLDTYWRESNGKIETLPEMENDKENVVERLFEFDKVLRSDAKDAEKAIALAWIIHLSGDVHQPLHASGRVTAEEPKGDQGGNTFSLSPKNAPRKENLHWFWDSIVVRTVPRKADASDAEYLLPIGNAIMKKYPLAKMQNLLEIGKFDAWQQESFKIASTRLYPKTLLRDQMPSAAYNKMAFDIAEQQIAIAGYRLGTWLNQIFGERTAQIDQMAARKEIAQTGGIVGQGKDDVTIWFKTRKALIDTQALRESTISLNVVDNVVTLRGTVTGKAQKNLAAQVTQKIDGVRAVKNELKVIN
jgi:osmotically-inducible protein OsmY